MMTNVLSVACPDKENSFSFNFMNDLSPTRVNHFHIEIPDGDALKTFQKYKGTYLDPFQRKEGPLLLIFACHGITVGKKKYKVGFDTHNCVDFPNILQKLVEFYCPLNPDVFLFWVCFCKMRNISELMEIYLKNSNIKHPFSFIYFKDKTRIDSLNSIVNSLIACLSLPSTNWMEKVPIEIENYNQTLGMKEFHGSCIDLNVKCKKKLSFRI